MRYPVEMKTHLEGAIAALQLAKRRLEAGEYQAAASQAAQAAFHTGSLLLLDEEIEPGQHGDVITLIQEIFVRGRRLTREQGGNLTRLFTLRDAGVPISGEDARQAVEIAEGFFEAAKVILEA